MKDQTAKTVARVLYERFIAVFGVPAKLLSDKGANFTSRLVEDLCSTLGIQKCHTNSYHAQHLTRGMPLGWLGGVLWSLPMVALSSTEVG